MPTGYTDSFQKGEVGIVEWIITKLSRAFGMCVMLREEPYDLTEKEIRKRVPEKSGYYEKEKAKAEKILKELQGRSRVDWVNAWQRECLEIKKTNKEKTDRCAKIRERHESAITDLGLLIAETKIQEVQSVAQFGIEQLNLCRSEAEPYLSRIPSFDGFQGKAMEVAERRVDCHKEALATLHDRNANRIRAFDDLCSETRRVLEKENT